MRHLRAESQRDALVALLMTLTDESFLHDGISRIRSQAVDGRGLDRRRAKPKAVGPSRSGASVPLPCHLAL
jgi:hypothetical protein